jgi:hypothetical protein
VTTSSGPFKYVERDFNVPPFSQSKLEVARCPGRTHVYGGGMVVLFQEGIVNASYPIDLGDRGRTPDDGWAVYYDNYDTNSPADVTIRAICGKTMPSYRRVGFTVGAGRAATRRVRCPNGWFAWGGGASNRGPFNTMNLSESAPSGARAWEATVSNFGSRGYSGVAHAICGPRRPVYARRSTGVGPAGALLSAKCPTQLQHVVSGGASHSAPGRMAFNSLFPLDLDGTVDAAHDDGFEVELENYTSSSHRATVYAVCLRR